MSKAVRLAHRLVQQHPVGAHVLGDGKGGEVNGSLPCVKSKKAWTKVALIVRCICEMVYLIKPTRCFLNNRCAA